LDLFVEPKAKTALRTAKGGRWLPRLLQQPENPEQNSYSGKRQTDKGIHSPRIANHLPGLLFVSLA
jgi:hypothetical protein